MRECSLRYDRDSLWTEVPLCLPPQAASALRAGISLKRAGDQGGAGADRREFLRAAGLAGHPVYACRQVHSHEVLEVGSSAPSVTDALEADGLLTDRPEALLTVTVADCLPIFLADPARGVFGLLHSGWRGTGILQRAVERMERTWGCPPEAITVTIGPGIGSCCYGVDERRAAVFRQRFGERAVCRREGRAYLDLRAANLLLLHSLGVERITVVRDCTACVPELSSYRRDGSSFARMLAFIGAAGRRRG